MTALAAGPVVHLNARLQRAPVPSFSIYASYNPLNPKEFVVIKKIVVGLLGLVFVLGLLGFIFFGAKLTDVVLPMLVSAIGIVAIELYYNQDEEE